MTRTKEEPLYFGLSWRDHLMYYLVLRYSATYKCYSQLRHLFKQEASHGSWQEIPYFEDFYEFMTQARDDARRFVIKR